ETRQRKKAQQKFEVSGRVTDPNGNPLYGVAVIEKSSNLGTGTNINGEYLLEVQSLNDTLIFSYLGYKRTEESIQDRLHIDVILTEEISGLSEIVLIGYGSQER